MTQQSDHPVPLGLAPSFGYGDRLGVATPGHVAAHKKSAGGIQPIFAQQSIREMTRTVRTPTQVMTDALRGAKEAGYTGAQGADADHLKTPQDVDRTAEAGFVFFTIDPSDHVDGKTDSYSEAELEQKLAAVRGEVQWVFRYSGKSVKLGSQSLSIDEKACKRCAVKYGKAVNHAIALAGHIDSVMRGRGRAYEIELSVDETPQPTTLAEHYMVADACLQAGMKLVSLAPRFVGEFEKGVDFKGDRAAFEKSLEGHAAIAKAIGPYKLSLHSGSDKLSIYPAFAKATAGQFHVKTAGTSYLEALRAVLRHDVELFRRITEFCRGRYDADKATYHVSAMLATTPPPAEMNAEQLEKVYLERWQDVKGDVGFTAPGRQILHTTFGSVLTHETFKPAVMQILREHPKTYSAILEEHFSKHLQALRKGM